MSEIDEASKQNIGDDKLAQMSRVQSTAAKRVIEDAVKLKRKAAVKK